MLAHKEFITHKLIESQFQSPCPLKWGKAEREKMNLDSLSELVEDILRNDVRAREDDMYLYGMVCKAKNVNAITEPFFTVCLKSKELGFPSPESVSRCRRKIQENNPSLCSDKAKDIRGKYEQMFLNFARG